MSFRNWQLRVQDILEAIASIERLTAGLTFETFKADEAMVKAVLYNFVIIGEASTSIPGDVKLRDNNIPWRLMSDMRNIMAHEYFQVNLRLTWSTVKNNLPALVPQLQDLLKHACAM